MPDDPRITQLANTLRPVLPGNTADNVAVELIAKADAADPLRLALQNPSDELLMRMALAHREYQNAYGPSHRGAMRAAIAALVEEFQPQSDSVR